MCCSRNNNSCGSFENLKKLCKALHLQDALYALDALQQHGTSVSADIKYRLLQSCIKKKDLASGREVYDLIRCSGIQSDTFIGSHLIRMFALCGSLSEANLVFTELPKHNLVAWSGIISAHAKLGHATEAIRLYYQMFQSTLKPGEYVFVAALKACSSIKALDEGKAIYSHIVESGCEFNVFVGSTLIDMYAKCERLGDAQMTFDKLHERNVVAWTAIITGYAQHGHGQEALRLYRQMQHGGIEPNFVTYICLLKACSALADLDQGRLFHKQIVETGCDSDETIGNSLVDMYGKCKKLEDAHSMFDTAPNRSVVTWTAMIAGYAQSGHGQKALDLLQKMQQDQSEPVDITLVSILNACSSIEALDQGMFVHALIMNNVYESDLFVENALVDMYAKCGSLGESRWVFDKLPKRDVVTWSAMIAGYAQQGCGKEAIHLFQRMQLEGLEPDSVTFGCILKACSVLTALDQGRCIHDCLMKHKCELDVFVGNSLIDMYVKCCTLEDAHSSFDQLVKRDVVAWSALIAGYAEHGHGQEAFCLFKLMQQDGLEPDNVTFVCMLKACSNIASLHHGKLIHEHATQNGSELDSFVGNTLIDLYVKCGRLEDAQKVFENLPKRELVTWSAMVAGCAQNSHGEEALQLFQQMQQQDMEPDTGMFVCILKACSAIAALDQGKLVHAQISGIGCEIDSFVASSLIDMYAKCGSLEDAHQVFEKLSKRDVVAWSAMIAGYAQNCDYHLALQYFKNMQQEGLKPNDVTYVSILSACSHRGLMVEGCHLFQSMKGDNGIVPMLDHYNCIVDLFGRAGDLILAQDLLQTMPSQPSVVAWMSLLCHCRTHGNVDLGRCCFNNISRVNGKDASGYMLMSKMYADAGQMEHADEMQEQRKSAHAWKKLGKAFIEGDSKVYNFFVGEKEHIKSHEILVKMQKTGLHMKREGYVPLVDLVLQPVCDGGDEDVLYEQYERLLLAD